MLLDIDVVREGMGSRVVPMRSYSYSNSHMRSASAPLAQASLCSDGRSGNVAEVVSTPTPTPIPIPVSIPTPIPIPIPIRTRNVQLDDGVRTLA